MPQSDLLLEVENLSVYYGNQKAVDNVSFSIKRGEIFCIVGESGSGKTTLLYSLARLLPSYARVEGKITFLGKDITKLPKEELNKIRGNQIGFIFQEPSAYLDPLFPVGEQIRETCFIHHPQRDCFKAALWALKKAGITDPLRVYYSYPHQLSGGLKQRVNIADAVVNKPFLILADEPTTALDVSTQSRILKLFANLKEAGHTIILVTHDLGVVWEIADRVMVMKDGKKVEEGSVYEIYTNPREEYTQRLVVIFKKLSGFLT